MDAGRLGKVVVDDDPHPVALGGLDGRAGHAAVKPPDVDEEAGEELARGVPAVEVELLHVVLEREGNPLRQVWCDDRDRGLARFTEARDELPAVGRAPDRSAGRRPLAVVFSALIVLGVTLMGRRLLGAGRPGTGKETCRRERAAVEKCPPRRLVIHLESLGRKKVMATGREPTSRTLNCTRPGHVRRPPDRGLGRQPPARRNTTSTNTSGAGGNLASGEAPRGDSCAGSSMHRPTYCRKRGEFQWYIDPWSPNRRGTFQATCAR